MLVPSHRHRPEDLALWRNLEVMDRLNGPRAEALAPRALAAVAAFAARGPCYASVSWGKDSVVLAHLVWRSGLPIPLFHVRALPTGNPDTPAVRDAFLARFPLPYHEETITYPFLRLTGEENPEGNRLFFAAFGRAPARRYLSGVRARESAVRKTRMHRWGLASRNTCAPLGWWAEANVFGYLAHHDLPVHPVYAMLGGGRWPREHLRVDELLGTGGQQFGRWQHEREYYGDVLHGLEDYPHG